MKNVGFVIEREVISSSHNEDDETSNIYTQLKEKLRKHVDSADTRTPWMKNMRKRGRRKVKMCDYTIHVFNVIFLFIVNYRICYCCDN
jgi:3-phenylpropionate/cinnamic acid dioxygenase small subunit